jgi:hypothetical protein
VKDRVLGRATSESGPVEGTREALVLPTPDGPRRIPWEQVEAATWDRDTGILRVTEVGSFGLTRPEHEVVVEEPGRLLELVRERVTASIVLQRHVAIEGERGVRIIARRAAIGARQISWFFAYDNGVDPDDPFVEQAAQEALAVAQAEIGLQ